MRSCAANSSPNGPQLDVPLNEALTWPADMIGEFGWKRTLPDKDAFGLGYKKSGVGRQCGIEGLEIFTETKTVGWPAS